MDKQLIRILMLGDSITFAGNWKELLNREDIFNAGMPGWTTEQLSLTVKDLMASKKPAVCLYTAGINDFSWGIATNRILSNNKMILDSIHSKLTVPVYQTLLYQLGNYRINREIDLLNDAMEEFCKSYKYEFLDLRAQLCKGGDLREEFTYDGTHLTEEAYVPWAEIIRPLLAKYGL